jgi:HSP20 family molecular chaperone IbpA
MTEYRISIELLGQEPKEIELKAEDNSTAIKSALDTLGKETQNNVTSVSITYFMDLEG